jgi:hypothetical protein
MLLQTMGTNNGKVADDISNSYQYGEGERDVSLTPSFSKIVDCVLA